MSALLQAALRCIERGWFVFPLVPKSKRPATINGKDAATVDEAQIRDWWGRQNPNFNVGVATGPSGLCVVDADYGLADLEAWNDWRSRNRLPLTFSVRSGRRSSYGVQMYFRGSVKDGKFDLDGVSGDIKSAGGYVLAAGSIHPDTGELYETVYTGNRFPAPIPASVIEMARKGRAAAAVDDGEPITRDRNSRLTSIAGKLRKDGLSAAALEVALQRCNLDRCPDPLPEEEVSRIVANVAKYPIGAEAPRVILGSGKGTSQKPCGQAASTDGAQDGPKPDNWRALFHTKKETEESPDPQFLIRDFLQEQSITGLIGPARARKSIIAVNMMHALLTGKPLFGKFEVTNRPERVVLLCPESGLLSLGRRIRNMGLSQFVGQSLFYTSMNSELIELDDPRIEEAAKGAVVFVDTLVRFFGAGEENSATDMKLFFAKCQKLMRSGVRAVVVIHHTAKNSEGIRLESGRGSGDFGGSLTAAWGTTLDNYEDAYNSHSLVAPAKERDFRAESFKVAPSGDDTNFFLQYVEGSNNARVQVGAKKKAGNAQAAALAKANPDLTAPKLKEALAAQGVLYSERTCRELLREARQQTGRSGVSVTAA